jgi:hypothetical protein
MHQGRAGLINDPNVMMRLGLPASSRQGGFSTAMSLAADSRRNLSPGWRCCSLDENPPDVAVYGWWVSLQRATDVGVVDERAARRPACGCVDLGRGGRTSLPSMRMLHLGLRVSDLEQSLAFYTALGYAELGRVPETEFGSLTMLQLPDDPTQALTAAPQCSMSAGR